ncbi:MAG: SpoIIE family protein phosphatase, partial [Lachnospiraceae bacterium]|nr:SpoIIE family protein phosphatase [Lachnospiraceae bacterium]
ATTFVKRGQWIELIKSTSLPMGVIDGAVCENCRKKFYHNDIIVMVSDGVLESIVVENSDDYLRDLLLNSDNQDVEEIATEIADAIGSISGNRLRDDASIIVVRLSKR